jgi:WD40 repeat protein
MMKIVMLVIGEIVQVKLAGDASFPKDVGSGGALQPSHNGQVVALQAMGPLLISGAQDGTMRIWDMRSPSTKDGMLLPQRDSSDTLSMHASSSLSIRTLIVAPAPT